MFDYQAGEKYKLTLIMVGLAGLMAGMFFAMLLMPSAEPPSRRKTAMTRAMSDPDITGHHAGAAQAMAGAMSQTINGGGQQASAQNWVDKYQAKNMIDQFLPLAWDLSAGSARNSQSQAMEMMTPECAMAYRQNIWTDDLAKQIEDAGLQSAFQPKSVQVSDNLNDGAVVIKVQANQSLGAAGKGRNREVNLEYMIRQTPAGLKIAGISDGGQAIH